LKLSSLKKQKEVEQPSVLQSASSFAFSAANYLVHGNQPSKPVPMQDKEHAAVQQFREDERFFSVMVDHFESTLQVLTEMQKTEKEQS